MEPIEIRARREALGLSQADLAGLLGVRQVAVSQWETGVRAPRDPVGLSMDLAAIEDRFDKLVEDLWEIGEHASAVRNTPEITLGTWASDSDYWAADAGAAAARTPAAMHRAATAFTARALAEEYGIIARITARRV